METGTMTWIMHIECLNFEGSVDLDSIEGASLLESAIYCMIPGETLTLTYEGDGDGDGGDS
jgi:hypothetical protein